MRRTALLRPTELVLLVYLLLTGLLVIFNLHALPRAGIMLVVRAVLIILVLALAQAFRSHHPGKALDLLRYMLPLASLAYLYSETDLLNNLFFTDDLDPVFIRMEEWVFGYQPSLAFASSLPSNLFAEAMYFGYFSYYLMLAAVPLFIRYSRGQGKGERAMFIVVNSFFIFYIFFIIFPVGGPQFHFRNWPDLPPGYVLGSLMRFIQGWGEAPTAAFPSSHVSICLMLIILSYRFARPLLRILIPVSVLLVLSTVYIRAHYVVDILGAFLVTWPLYRLSGRIYDRLSFPL